jgi:hypothetical protein
MDFQPNGVKGFKTTLRVRYYLKIKDLSKPQETQLGISVETRVTLRRAVLVKPLKTTLMYIGKYSI